MADMVVEDGSGVVTANAYATTDEVDAINEVNIHSNWSLASDDDKERLIIWATRQLDERVKWNGRKTHDTQGLGWPRTGVRDKDCVLIDDDVVPVEVKTAVAVLANHLLTTDTSAVNSATNLTGLQVDVVELKFDAKLYVAKYPDEISYILAGLGTVYMGKGGYKRIIKH